MQILVLYKNSIDKIILLIYIAKSYRGIYSIKANDKKKGCTKVDPTLYVYLYYIPRLILNFKN